MILTVSPAEAVELHSACELLKEYRRRKGLACLTDLDLLIERLDVMCTMRSDTERQTTTVTDSDRAGVQYPTSDQAILTFAEAATLCRCSKRTIERRVGAGELRTVGVGKLRRIARVDLDAYLRRGEGDN